MTHLRKLGRTSERRSAVASAFKPLLDHEHAIIAFTISYSLAELEDDAGRAILIRGYEEDLGSLHHFPGSDYWFPNRFLYGDSSITASAYCLGLLGDTRGLTHDDCEVKLVIADALLEKDPSTVKQLLAPIAEELDKEVN